MDDRDELKVTFVIDLVFVFIPRSLAGAIPKIQVDLSSTTGLLERHTMFLTHSFQNKSDKGVLTESKTMFGTQGGLQHQKSVSMEQDCCSFHGSLLEFMLIAKNVSLLKEMKQSLFEMDLVKSCVDATELSEKKMTVKMQPGNSYNVQRSNECLIPGLHDDIALDCLAFACRSDYPSLACLNKSFNLLVGSGYLYKWRRRLGIIEHWVYLACSLMPWEAFDPTRLRWMRLPRMPCDDCFSYADKESLAVGTQLLVFGRELTGFAIWMYSLVRRDWSRCPLMNLPRCLFGSSSSGEIAIFAGGSDKNGHVLKCAEMYNSELGIWESLPDMNLPRKMCSGFFLDGNFYVIGGMSSHTDSLTCGEEYNLETRTWRRIQNMYPGGNLATQSPPLVAVVNNQLYAADQSTNEVKKYDKVNNTWNVVKPLPVRANYYNGWGLAFKACGDKLLVIGGHREPQGEVIVLWSWCPEDTNNGGPEWDVLSVRERAGAFVYNCAIMGC
ncbi:hypothetical protein KFK09_021964 [Dendrobium nobile]|uniref:F-box/kelch-repeat protein n=1 Tax=Dendrobium nobile TaxID=94219 RepID=A0A8T3AI14_DENNO|nr:hypothetical protein KFK09_021964 [Dendrobium nobile]